MHSINFSNRKLLRIKLHLSTDFFEPGFRHFGDHTLPRSVQCSSFIASNKGERFRVISEPQRTHRSSVELEASLFYTFGISWSVNRVKNIVCYCEE